MVVSGIDVSNHQGVVDWKQVADAGYKFAFIKCTQGINFRDQYFERNWYEAAVNGFQRGAYHFPEPFNNPDARVEADFFFDFIAKQGDMQQGDMLVLDMEVVSTANHRDYSGWMNYWMEITKSYFLFDPLSYTSPYYAQALHLANEPKLGAYPLWIATYLANAANANLGTIPKAPYPWNSVAFWQYSEKGRVPGINTNCDLNIFNGAEARMKLYGFQKTEKPPTPTKIDVAAIEQRLKDIEQDTKNIAQATTRINTYTQEIRTLLGGSNTPT